MMRINGSKTVLKSFKNVTQANALDSKVAVFLILPSVQLQNHSKAKAQKRNQVS